MIFLSPFRQENAVQKTREKSPFCCCCSPLFASARRDSNRRLMAYICSVFTAQQKTLTCYCRALSASRTASSLGQTRLSAGPVCDVTRRQVNTVGDILFISRGFVVGFFFVISSKLYFCILLLLKRREAESRLILMPTEGAACRA